MDELPVPYTITTIFMPCNKDSNLCWTAFLLLAVLKGRLFFLTRYSACAFMCTMLLFLCCLFVHRFPYLRAKGPASPCTRTLEITFTPYMLGFEIEVWSLSCFQIQLLSEPKQDTATYQFNVYYYILSFYNSKLKSLYYLEFMFCTYY